MSACPDFELLSALHDGEEAPGVRTHVDACPRCREILAELSRLGDGLRAMPEARREVAPPVPKPAPARTYRWLAVPAAAAAILFGVWTSGHRALSPALADEVVSQHLRAFANGRACEIESANADDVSRFLSDRLDRPIRLAAPHEGALVGARRCSLFGERAGAVVLRDDKVAVTVFLPEPGSAAAKAGAKAVGQCTTARDGQTVCVLAGTDGPRLAVGELPPARLGELLASN